MKDNAVFSVAKHLDHEEVWYSVVIDPRALPVLAKAIANEGRGADGHAVEAVLIALSEIGDAAWADELIFDAEAEACTVRCRRRAPLVHLLTRLERRAADPARLRRMVRSLPPE